MHMTAHIKGPRLADLVAISPRAWGNAGKEARDSIQKRTLRGVDADGVPFLPYSEGYARAKRKKSGLIGGGRVNLMSANAGAHMLQTMMVTASATQNPRIKIWFSLAEKAEIANYHMEDGRVLRQFFALSDDDVDAIVAYIRKFMGKK